MTTVFELQQRYRLQHIHLYVLSNCLRGANITKQTRRQKQFIPRGNVYKRLLMLEINKI